eukprot:6188385-Alexandrium_andersonii.AAC.1
MRPPAISPRPMVPTWEPAAPVLRESSARISSTMPPLHLAEADGADVGAVGAVAARDLRRDLVG